MFQVSEKGGETAELEEYETRGHSEHAVAEVRQYKSDGGTGIRDGLRDDEEANEWSFWSHDAQECDGDEQPGGEETEVFVGDELPPETAFGGKHPLRVALDHLEVTD